MSLLYSDKQNNISCVPFCLESFFTVSYCVCSLLPHLKEARSTQVQFSVVLCNESSGHLENE